MDRTFASQFLEGGWGGGEVVGGRQIPSNVHVRLIEDHASGVSNLSFVSGYVVVMASFRGLL